MPTTSSPLKAVLFDLDGTLVDSYAAITASVNHVRQQHQLAPLPIADVRRFVGRGPEYLLRHTVPGVDPVSGYALYRAHHPSVLRDGTKLLPGAAEVLQALQQTGRRIAICSNKPRLFTLELLDILQLAAVVDVVIGPEDVAQVKPAPDMVLTALQRLGVTAVEALYVGDMTVDIQTARAAGVTVWVLPTGSDDRPTLEAARPDRVVTDLHALRLLLAPNPPTPPAFP